MRAKRRKYDIKQQKRKVRLKEKGLGFSFYYNNPESEVIVNDDDPDLERIIIKLPPSPKPESIDGWGMTTYSQIFRRQSEVYPEVWRRLMEIQKRLKTVEECVAYLRANASKYSEEIAFIQRDHQRFRDGYWFFNNGTPTYITGAHYRYLNYWYAGKGHPEYRSRDKKFYVFLDFVEADPFACGMNYPKFRREGATSKVSCWLYNKTAITKSFHAGIQSKDDESASRVFHKHIVQNWKKLPFWQKPVHEGRSEPKSALNFFPPSISIGNKGTSSTYTESLESWIDFGPSTEGHYDGDKLGAHYGDEVGKSTKVDVYQRHLIVKPCVTEGNQYIGTIINTSTVGEMEKGGGDSFKMLCSESHYNKRNDNGETNTGLYNLFIPSYDGYDLYDKNTGKRFIDRWGNSDIAATKVYLENRRRALLEKGDMEGLAEEIRQYPFTFRECFRGGAAHCNFNINILETRLDDFRFGNPHTIRGDFVWKDEQKDTTVIWRPSANGKFLQSYLLPPGMDNKYLYVKNVKVPGNKRFGCAGGDPFKFDDVTSNKKSDGAGAVFMKYDPSIDDPNGDPDKWVSDRFCCTYSNRPRTREIYGEDMLMMCVYYGIEMNPEYNVTFLADYFKQRGYGGYLYYQTDKNTGKYSKNPGLNTSQKIQEEIFGEYYTLIERNGHREVHDEILTQCRDIEDDMGPYDLFVAGGYALLGCRRVEQDQTQKRTVPSFHHKIKYQRP